MGDSIDALFEHPAPVSGATLTATTTPKAGTEIDDLFGGGVVSTRAAPLAQRAPAPVMHAAPAMLGPPSPPAPPVEPPMQEPSTPNGLVEGLGLTPTADRIGSGVAAGRENLLRGFMAAGNALGMVAPQTIDEQTADAQRAAEVADATGIGHAVHTAADLAPWLIPGGQAVGAVSSGGNRFQDITDQGGSHTKALLGGIADAAVAVIAPKIVHATLGAAAAKAGAAVAERLGPMAGKIAADAITGGATGGALTTGEAGVSAATGDRARAVRELKDIPEQVGVGAGLGAGGAILARLFRSAGAPIPRGEEDGSEPPAAPAAPEQSAPAAPEPPVDHEAALRQAGIDPAVFREELARANARAAELAQTAMPHGPQGGGAVEHPITPEDAAAEAAARFRESESGAGTIQPATHEAPSGQASPTNPAPTEPAVPAPNQEVHHGEEVQGQAAPEALLNDGLTPGSAVDVRAGRQFLRAEVLSRADDGTFAVRIADGRTLKGVQPHRVIPVREEPADAGRGRAGAVDAGNARADATPADVAGATPPAPVRMAASDALVAPRDAAVPAEHGTAAWPAAAAERRSPEPAPADAPLIADVPYGGGISQDGQRVFIDPRIPRFVDVGGQPVDAHRFIAIHERAEKPFLDAGMDYAGAHQKATAVERAAVERAGIDFDAYQRALKPYLDRARAEAKPENVPPELDRKPYVDSGEQHLVGERAAEAPRSSEPTEAKRVRRSAVDSPAQGDLAAAKQRTADAWKRVQDLRARVKAEPIGGDRHGLRLELLKATEAHAEAKRAVRGAKDTIERRAQELGQTTEPGAAHVDRAAAAADTAPTEAQKEAGNYEKGHVRLHGLDVTIENPKGSERSGTDANGKPWSVDMPAHYGYVRGTKGADGDHVDVYIGPHPQSGRVFVIDQVDAKTGKFDEHKAMLGFDSRDAAVKAYDAAFSDSRGPERRGAVTDQSVDEFKAWLDSGETKKPLAYTAAARAARARRLVAAAAEAKRGAAKAPSEAADQREGADAYSRGETAQQQGEQSPAWWKGFNEASAADAPLFGPERTPGEPDAPATPPKSSGSPEFIEPPHKSGAERNTPSADEPLQMPDAKDGIESLIRYALDERERTIADLRKRVEKGGGLADEWRHDLEQHEGVDPEALAKDMREFPQHYLRAMTERGGSMSAVGVYRNRVRMPPQQPRVQVAPLPIGTDQAPDLARTLRSLKDDLKKAAPSAPTFDVDRGALPDKAGGQFDPRSGAITTRHHNDLDLVAHEVGHWAAEKHDLMPEENDRDTRAELARFAVHGSPAKGATAQREGMAEYLRAWMVNPEAAEARAPHFTERMREKLPPRVLEALRRYGDEVRRFEGASALKKMAAGQQRTSAAIAEQKREGRFYTPIWQGVKDFLGVGLGPQRGRPGVLPKKFDATIADKARFHLTDKEAPQLANYLTSLELTGQDAAKMTPSQHWDFLRKSLRGVASKVRDGVIHNGLPNIDGTVAKDPVTGKPMALPWLLDPAPKKSEDLGAFLDKAHAYGSAQRTLELADRFTRKAEDEISRYAEAQVRGTGGDRLRMDAAEKAVREFAASRRAMLRAQLARLTAAGGGIRSATEVAREAVAELESDPARAPVEEYLRRYRAWSDWNLQYAVDRELLTPGDAEGIRQANQFYIDWHRVFADEDGPVNLGEAVKGSTRTMHNPLASLLYTTWQTINRGDRNGVMNTFVAPLRMAPKDANGPALAQLGRKISEEAATEAATKTAGYHADAVGGKARVYHTQRLVQEMNADGSPLMGPDGEPMQKIETEHWIFDPASEASLEAMRAESGDDPWNKIVQGLVSFQKLAITSAPAFRFKVPFRDNIDRLMVTENGSSIADTAYGMGKKLLDPVTGEEVDLDRIYHQSGAGMAGVFRRSREQAMADVFAHVEDLKKQGYKVMTPGTAWRWWQHMGEASENIARKAEFAAAFRKARAQLGYSQLDASLYAMTHARELLDTSESGHTIARLNRFFLFLNAGTKGLQRMSRPLRRAAAAYQAGDYATGNRIAALIPIRLAGLGGTFAAIRLMHLMFSDDKHQEQLLEQPSWKRDFAITTPDFGLGKLAIPKPYEWGVLGSAFERIADAAWATGKAQRAAAAGDSATAQRWREHARRAGEGWGHSAVTALLPLKFDDILGGGLAPITEVMFNQSLFTNAPLMPQNEATEKLALRKHAADASLVGRGLSKVVAPVLGDTFGDPRSIDHLLQGYLGGWGTSVTARDFGEVARRFSGYSGETSPYAERDTRWVLDWAAENGVGGRKPFEALRRLAKEARDAPADRQQQALDTMRNASINLRRAIEGSPDAYAKHIAAGP